MSEQQRIAESHGFRTEFDEATRIATVVMQMDGRANKINRDFGEGLSAAFEAAVGVDGVRGVIIASGHKDWCVGADIDVLFGLRDPAAVNDVIGQLNALFRRIETCGLPVVAAITGSALGGGYELALACHHRVALDDPRIQVGLPEVNLGVFPGAGGTQRLPRRIGLQAGIEHILQGKLVRAPQAAKAGLVDALAKDEKALRTEAESFVADNPKAKQPWDRRGFRWPGVQPDSPEGRNLFGGATAMLLKQTAGAFPAPEAALEAIYEGTFVGMDAALAIEQRHFVGAVTRDSAKDMLRTVWYHRTAAEKLEGMPTAEDAPPFRRVGILGAGMMGAGLAAVAAQAGYDVVLKDIDQGALDKGLAAARKILEKRARRLSGDEAKALYDRVRGTLAAKDLDGVDLVIEAVVEAKKVKHAVIRETEAVMADDGVFASNTSALPITELAEASKRPEAFLGLHFFSPVERMPLVEVIRAANTSDRTIARALAFCRKIKKVPILVNDGYAFYTTRVFARYILEGAQLVLEGHDPALVEWAAKSAGMMVPPLKVFDEVTLTLGQHVIAQSKEYVGEEEGLDAKELIEALVAQGRTGKAAKKGFYDYEAQPRRIWAGLADLARETPAETGVPYLQRRILLVQAVEAVRALDEGVLRSPADGDLGAVMGLGFAPNTGGPFAWLDRQDKKALVAELDALAQKHGPRYAPTDLLRRMAENDERFYEQ